MTIALPLTDFSSGRTADPHGDTTQRESRFRRRRQSRRAGYKSDYRNIANVIFPASGCEPSHIGDSVYWLLLSSSRMKDGVVSTGRYTTRRNSFCKIIIARMRVTEFKFSPIARFETQIDQSQRLSNMIVKAVNIFVAHKLEFVWILLISPTLRHVFQ